LRMCLLSTCSRVWVDMSCYGDVTNMSRHVEHRRVRISTPRKHEINSIVIMSLYACLTNPSFISSTTLMIACDGANTNYIVLETREMSSTHRQAHPVSWN
jgi:hypothetical protein